MNSAVNLVDTTGLAPGDLFINVQDAAVDGLRYIWDEKPDSKDREYCAPIIKIGNCYTYEEPTPGTPREEITDPNTRGECSYGPKEDQDVAWFHNHIENPSHSSPDKVWTHYTEDDGYSGVRDAAGNETFHVFKSGTNPDTGVSTPFAPNPSPQSCQCE